MSFSAELWSQEFTRHACPSWICDSQGVIVEVNRAVSAKYGAAGTETLSIAFGSHTPQVLQIVSNTVGAGQVRRYSLEGETVELEVRDLGGHRLLRLCPLQEATDQQERLRRLGALSGGLFHAIRNPLTIVQGRVELMQMMISDPAVQRTLDIVYNQCERIATLLDTTQQITVHSLQLTQFSMNTVLKKVFGSAEHQFDFDSLPSLFVYNDENRIRIALELLLERMEGRQNLQQIRIEKRESTASLILQCDLTESAQRFFHDLQNALDETVPLILTSSTREQHLQMLNVIFTDCKVFFQCQGNRQLTLQLAMTQQQTTNLHILVVDDDEILRETVVALLSLQGHQIYTANTAEEAQMMWTEQMDVVLLDINLPKMSGLELVQVIQQEHPSWVYKVVLISGIGEFARPAGVRFLQKPFSKRQLNDAIERVVRQ